jgi:tetratricopeptide (TPR) repeat protein
LVAKAYDNAIAANPGNWDLREPYVKYLQDRQDYVASRRIIGEWLSAHQHDRTIKYVFAQTALARQLYLQGHYDQAWTIIQPVISSQQAGAMQRAAMILDRLDRRNDAEKLQKAVVDRYPDDVFQRTVLAQFYWEWGRPNEAAVVLKSGPRPLSIDDWEREAAPKFTEVYAKRSQQEALAAFASLLSNGIGAMELERVANQMSNARKDDTAFRMAQTLHWGNPVGDLTFRIDGYTYLKRLKGETAALEWVRTAIPPAAYNPTTMMAFTAGEYELLWNLVDKPQPGYGEDFAWAMRAAAMLKLGKAGEKYRAGLLSWYKQHPSGYWETIGRYLVGLADENEVLSEAQSTQQRCEVSYYLGLRAQSEGRLKDASDWYRISIESGMQNMGEYRWAYNQLYLWEGEGKSLERIATEAGTAARN